MSKDPLKARISVDHISFKRDKGSKAHVCFGVHNLCDLEQSFSIQIDVLDQDRAVDLTMIEAEETLLARLKCLSADLKNYIDLHRSRIDTT